MRRLAVAACVLVTAACSGRLEEKPVNGTRQMTGRAIPPIDRDVPERFETATFATG